MVGYSGVKENEKDGKDMVGYSGVKENEKDGNEGQREIDKSMCVVAVERSRLRVASAGLIIK